MLQIKKMLWAALCLLVIPMVGCEEQIDTNNPPTMELDIYQLNVTGEGGDIPVFYTVTNAIKGEMPEAKANVDWIVPIEITSYSIMLRIAESDSSEERTAL